MKYLMVALMIAAGIAIVSTAQATQGTSDGKSPGCFQQAKAGKCSTIDAPEKFSGVVPGSTGRTRPWQDDPRFIKPQ